MYITDLEGTKIHVTNLELAIAKADAYRHYQHTDKKFADLDKWLVDYWNNIYEQLIQLRK
jgi:hypothetical protein